MVTPAEAAAGKPTKGEIALGIVFIVAIVVLLAVL
jgi:hypothetical protein